MHSLIEPIKSRKTSVLIWESLLYALAAFPLYPLQWSGIFLGAWVIVSGYLRFKYKLKATSAQKVVLLVLALPYFLQIYGVLLSDEIASVLFPLEKSLPILLFPLGFFLSAGWVKRYHVKYCFYIFIAACFILNAFALLEGVRQGVIYRVEEDSLYNPIFRNLFADATGIHLPYLGLWFMFAALAIIHILHVRGKGLVVQALGILVLLSLIAGTLLFSARVALLAFLAAVFLYFIVYYRSVKVFFIAAALIGAFCVAIMQVPTIADRIEELPDSNFSLPEGKPWDPGNAQYNSINLRMGIIYCSLELLQEHWLLGVGTGDLQRYLNNCYAQFPIEGHDDYQSIEYNTHNQYAHFWLGTGLIGFVLFLSVLLFLIVWALKQQNTFLLAAVLYFSIGLLTENLLERHAGIFFYALVFSLLSFYPLVVDKKVSVESA